MDSTWEAERERFCVESHQRLVAALTHHVGDPELGQELAHEALVRAWNDWERVRTLESPAGWAFRVGVNLGNSWFRRRQAERRARQRHGGSPRVEDSDVALSMTVRRALQQLPPRQREALIHHHFLGSTVEQTAAVMGTSPGSVRGLLYRGTATLRSELAAMGEEVSDAS